MKVSFNSAIVPNYYLNSQRLQKIPAQPSFGSAKARKLMDIVRNTKSFKNVHATFEDMVAVYEELGFNVILKRGSHAVVPITKTANLPLVIPHGSKYVHFLDIKRLYLVLNGQIEKALNIH